MKIAIAQINTTVGDLQNNEKKILEYIQKAQQNNVDIICFPELTITGYPPEDLLLKPKFIKDNLEILKNLTYKISQLCAIIGFVNKKDKSIFNSACVIYDKKIVGIYDKSILPNYSVFDEKRYFSAGDRWNKIFKIEGLKFGILICEDIWHKQGPVKYQAQGGADIIFVINASPYYAEKIKEREKIISQQAKKYKVAIIYVNLVGGQDELIFDGQSICVDKRGKTIFHGDAFKEELYIFNIKLSPFSITYDSLKKTKKFDTKEEIYNALLLGLKDYVNKNKFKKVVIGLSGGIDSSLTATIAVDALGSKNVIGVCMPSKFTSYQSIQDAILLANNLGIELKSIPITPIYDRYLESLKEIFANLSPDITEENIQARIRGNILMALSNKFNWLVITTGNKSEVSTGYCTLYGDMAGGFNVIKDVTKTLVYKLSHFKNKSSNKEIIPLSVLTKPPSAELKDGQKDSDSLPEYEILDPILKYYIEQDKSPSEIVKLGFNKELVLKVVKLVDNNEYKRRQSTPGIKITPKAFGKDRRMPIVNHYEDNING